MLGLTVRASDNRRLLMGQAVLKIHEYDGIEYVPEGYWCAGINENGLPLPIEESSELDRFTAEWNLSRSSSEPGLSVVVPYVAPELKGSRILQAICVHFFLPIIQGKLIVELNAPDTHEVILNDKSLEKWCQSIKWDGPKRTKRHIAPPVSFVERCLVSIDLAVSTKVLGTTKLPELNESAFDIKPLEDLRETFGLERLTAVRVKMALPKKSDPDEIGELVVFLHRQTNGDRFDTYYVREGMTITKLNSRAGLRGVHAFVLVDRGPLASLLGDSEGPAHEDWDTSEERPNRTWTKWKGRVKFCRRIVDELTELLTVQTEKADFELLSDFFSIEKTKAPNRSRLPSQNGEGRPNFGDINAKPRWYRLDGRRGGFRIVRNTSKQNMPLDARLQVTVAYDLPSGNPLNRWSPFDFDFQNSESLKFSGKKVAAKTLSGNVLILNVEDDQFSFTVDGFDEHRDLLVRIDEIVGDIEEVEETSE